MEREGEEVEREGVGVGGDERQTDNAAGRVSVARVPIESQRYYPGLGPVRGPSAAPTKSK